MKSLLFVVLISLFGCGLSNSQTTKKSEVTSLQMSDAKEIDGYVKNFFDKYKNEGTDKAFDYIVSINKKPFDASVIKNKLDSVKNVLGEFTGYKLITEKNVSDELVLRSYLVKHENHPIRFTIVFYKPRDHWSIYKFSYDADITDELEQSGKIYFIK